MRHYFEYRDDKSNKFWNITLCEKSFTVSYGKIGSDGQIKVKKFKSVEEASKEAEKLMKEKLEKGYVEINNGNTTQAEPVKQEEKPVRQSIKLTPEKHKKKDGTGIIDPIPVTEEVINKYKSTLPAELIALWEEDGFCGYFEGVWWTINPDEYLWIVDEWKSLNVGGIPILRNKFGDILFTDKEDDDDLNLHLLNISDRTYEFVTGDDWEHFSKRHFSDKYYSFSNKPSSVDLELKYGDLDRNHCFGYIEIDDPVNLIPAVDEMEITPVQEYIRRVTAFMKHKISDITRIWGGIHGKIVMEGQFKKIGMLKLSSGNIIAADPIVCPDRVSFDRKVPKGNFPVYAYYAPGEKYDTAFSLVSFSDNEPKEWEHYNAHPVDAGVSAFFDAETAKIIIEKCRDDEQYLLGKISLNKKGEMVDIDPDHNIAAFATGDGTFNSSFAIDEKGNAVFLLSDYYGMRIDYACDNLNWRSKKKGMSPERLRKKMLTYLENHDREEAIGLAKKFLKKDPEDRDALYVMAESNYWENKYDDAIKIYKTIAKKYPDDVDIASQIGNCYDYLDQNEKALRVFENITKKFPESWWGWYKSGDILVKMKRYKEALEMYKKALTFEASWKKDLTKKINETKKLIGK